MRKLLLCLLIAGAASASAQPASELPSATLEALRRDFPQEALDLESELAGKTGAEARRIAYSVVDQFLRNHRSDILAAPGPSLVAIESRQGPMLRFLARSDVRHCAEVGDGGFFSSEALAAPMPPSLDAYGVALVEAAKAGAASETAGPVATSDDFVAWLAVVETLESDVPVREMLLDRELRASASADHLCRGAAAMHEAVMALPGQAGERIARTLLESVIGSEAT